MCTASYSGSCSGKCNAGGVVVCDGLIRQFQNDAQAALDWVKQHVTYSAYASASCSGNTCNAQAGASASCAAMPPDASVGGLTVGALGALAVAVAVGRVRKRRVKKTEAGQL
jgi:hypothetical protein